MSGITRLLVAAIIASLNLFSLSALAQSSLINISTRGQVQTGDNVMIGGFIIQGSTPKKVLIRAVGPNLANFGVTGVLVNPTLQLYSGQTVIASNDDWQTQAIPADVAAIEATTLAPVSPLESAILTTLSPGTYTAIVSGKSNTSGVGIVEVYEIDHPEIPLINISTRGQVQTGNNVMIGGFIIGGSTSKTVLIRAVGPNLANFGVTGVLTNPTLQLYSGQTVIASNDDWGTALNAAAIQTTGLAPVNSLESAILTTLAPGAYTAIVSGANDGTGVGIIEVYALPSPSTDGIMVGILTDALVGGVAYTTSSGVTGTTDASGGYKFNPGDTVEFRLGTLVLGNVVATGIVSPIDLASGNANKLTNLLVLFQSLDADGVPANGISIPASAAAAVTTAIDLTVAPSSFNSIALQTAMTAGGITAPIVTTTAANAHFLAQGMALLSSNIWVSQPAANTAGRTILLRFAANGEYLHGEAGVAERGGTAGAEHGTVTPLSFDVNGYQLKATTTVDTNGEWGASHPSSCDRMRSSGDELIVVDGTLSGTTCTNAANSTVSKAENNPTGIVGVWALDSATTINTQHFAFFSNGKFLMIDPSEDDQNSCGGPGVESGSYTYDAAAKVLRVSGFNFDTNGCAGLSQSGAVTPGGITFSISPDGKTATIIDTVDSWTDTMYRVSK